MRSCSPVADVTCVGLAELREISLMPETRMNSPDSLSSSFSNSAGMLPPSRKPGFSEPLR